MKRAHIAALSLVGLVSCREGVPDNCTGVRLELQAAIAEECEDRAFAANSFCGVCVRSGYYSFTSTVSDCICAPLEFAGGQCASYNDREKIRAALDTANASCSTMRLPGAATDSASSDSVGDSAEMDTADTSVAADVAVEDGDTEPDVTLDGD